MPDEEIVGDVVDPTNLEPETPVETPVETVETPPVAHEPPPDHPRFNEIYGKMKDFERQLNDKEELIGVMGEHNQSLQERMDAYEDKLSNSERPDAITDPEGHDKWLEDRIVRNIKREEPKPAPPKPVERNEIKEQAAIMESMFPDFNGVANFANELLKEDASGKMDIMDAKNPPRALYEYGLKKRKEIADKRTNNIAQASVEGGGTPPTQPSDLALTDTQKRMVKGLGITEKQYVAQLKFADKRGYK